MKKMKFFLLMFISISYLFCSAKPNIDSTNLEKLFGKNEIGFTENKGQIIDIYGKSCDNVLYNLKTKDFDVALTKDGIHFFFNQRLATKENNFRFGEQDESKILSDKLVKYRNYRVDFLFKKSNSNVIIKNEIPTKSFENFYLNYHDAPIVLVKEYKYKKITYKDIYNNIDFVIYIKDNKLEYDFVVNKGGNVNDIQMEIKNADNSIDNSNNLKIETPVGYLIQSCPSTFQSNGKMRINSSFILNNNMLTFSVDNYDKNQALIIDPTISWFTYYGGTGTEYYINGGYSTKCMTFDNSNNIYIIGTTLSSGICFNGYDVTFNGNPDALICKFNPSGGLVWSSYFGGASTENGNTITTDELNNIYIGVETNSNNLLYPSASYTIKGFQDIIIAKFNSAGVIQKATYHGGTGVENYPCFTYDKILNKLYMAYSTTSNDITMVGSTHDNTSNGGYDGFITNLDKSTLNTTLWNTYYGGSNDEFIQSIDVNKASPTITTMNRDIAICGSTRSTTGIAFSGPKTTISSVQDAFVAVFQNNGAIRWSSYYGGNADDYAYDLTMDFGSNSTLRFQDNLGNWNSSVLLVGQTKSNSGISTSNNLSGASDGFISLIYPKSATYPNGLIAKSAYYGGINNDAINNVVYQNNNGFFIALTTNSPNMGEVSIPSDTYKGMNDVFVSNILFNTPVTNNTFIKNVANYLGGIKDDFPLALGYNSTYLYCFGITSTTGMGVSGFQNTYGGGLYDYFLTKFRLITANRISNPYSEDKDDYSMNIYPNPTTKNSIIHIDSKNLATLNNLQYSLFDINGKEMPFETRFKSDYEIIINIKDLPAGVYLLQLRNDKIDTTKKIIVQD